ncbi:alpha-amylase family glycosyl hydrolase [Glaciecola sp. SC05]|uniref:alpha-amylase family glycosyl hydrolase n=1 Tax=Glaciecola sp. SC05 TaxID=1987355 RepID=UPI0035282C7A
MKQNKVLNLKFAPLPASCSSRSSLTSLSIFALVLCTILISACSEGPSQVPKTEELQQSTVPMINPSNVNASNINAFGHSTQGEGKPIIYQVFTRLFGNTNENNIPWGSIEQNGVGKFNDFTDQALLGIKELGTSYIWYTGVPHHGVINDYSDYGISLDDPDVIKGRAGSPYAVRDYYNVNPDLAVNVNNRMEEFEALIARTHKHGMKVIIDIVPNHVARNYQSLNKPQGQEDFGQSDNTSVEYARDNNFYYVIGEDFKVPQADGYAPLGGEAHPLADGLFTESPAKWTGNGARVAQPNIDDWYETVRINYGVRPDGSYDFDSLPEEYRSLDYKAHHAFWAERDLPDSWYKFEAIVHFWMDKGVDGFRFDMAEMVPVEFWSFLNASIKSERADTLLLAEVYQPHLYRDYLQLGKMDYLYDKVEFYDSLKLVMQGHGPMSAIADIQQDMADIEAHMLHFLENHDEQRIASDAFAGSAEKGKPAMVVSALISRSPTMLYFGQELGEDGSEDMGFGKPTRTTIFDYAGVPAHQRWMNGGKFDGGLLSDSEKALRQFYIDVMRISAHHPAMSGQYQNLHRLNLDAGSAYSEQQFAFVRYTQNKALLVLSNFSDEAIQSDIQLPIDLITKWGLDEGEYAMLELLGGEQAMLKVARKQSGASVRVSLPPLGSYVYELSLGAPQ